ncbi:MAG: hypothetical protein ACOYXB_08240 [Bacteroidota bacterium]
MKRLSFFLLLIFSMIHLRAQNEKYPNRFNLQIGLADRLKLLQYFTYYESYRISLNYILAPDLSIAVFGGYTPLYEYNTYDQTRYFRGNGFFYGTEVFYYINPIALNKKMYTKLYFYLKGRIGGFSAFPIEVPSLSKLDYGIYGGVYYYPFAKYGVFAELGYGRHSYSQFGFSFRFK